MTSTARELAFLVVRDTFGTPPRAAQAAFEYRVGRSELIERDRAFAGELAYGTIKARRLLNWWLQPYLETKFKTLPNSIAEILRMGVYQLMCMDGVAPHAAVNETVGLALRYGHRGTAGLVNAVLRRIERDQPMYPSAENFSSHYECLAIRYSLPTWIVERFAQSFGNELLEPICRGLNTRPQTALTVDSTQAQVSEILQRLKERGIDAHGSPFVAQTIISSEPGALFEEERERRGWIQGESAAMPVDLLDIKPGEKVLELCAGRGNKSMQIAAALRGQGWLEAIEIDQYKADHLLNRLAAAGHTNVEVRCCDAVSAEGPPVDAVIVDAPCSGLGILGRHPEARWRKAPEDALRHAHVQQQLLQTASERLAPQGRLVYSVCSSDRVEGEAVIQELIAQDSRLDRVPVPERYSGFSSKTALGDIVVPPGIDGRDGFFMSVLRRQ